MGEVGKESIPFVSYAIRNVEVQFLQSAMQIPGSQLEPTGGGTQMITQFLSPETPDRVFSAELHTCPMDGLDDANSNLLAGEFQAG